VSEALGLPSKYFQAKFTERGEIPEIQLLIGMKIHPITQAITYDLIPPILCLNGDNSSSKNYFRNPCLFVVRF